MTEDQVEYDCSECGSPVLADAAVCPACGASLEEVEWEEDGSAEQEAVRVLPLFRPGRMLAHLYIVLTAMQIVLHLASAATSASHKAMLERYMEGQAIVKADADDVVARTVTIAVLQLLVTFPGSIIFFIWLYRVCYNLPALGAEGLKYTPGWAVGGFFVPFLNIIHPYEVFTEVWKASDPSSAEDGSWQQAKRPLLVMLWWGFTLLSIILVVASFLTRPAPPGSTAVLIHLRWQEIAMSLVGVVVAALSIALAYAINTRQEEKHTSLCDVYETGGGTNDRPLMKE